MTSNVEIEMDANGLPNTFVPARNLLFLTFAASVAYRRGIKHIITGVCETDYSVCVTPQRYYSPLCCSAL